MDGNECDWCGCHAAETGVVGYDDEDVFPDPPCTHPVVEFDYTVLSLVCQCCGEPVNNHSEVANEG